MPLTLREPHSPMDWARIYALYRRAFPREERKPFAMIRRMKKAGKTDLWLLDLDGRFAGLAITINGPETILLDYFAIHDKKRGKGVGSAALQAVLTKYADKAFFLEIEYPLSGDPDGHMARRKAFYLRNGLTEMNTHALLFGVPMELLGRGCTLDFDGYREFYRANYSEWAAQHVCPMKED